MLSGMLNNLQGLQGLQANQVKMDEFNTQRMNRSKATELLRSYQETQDPAKLNEAILLDGELANNVLTGLDLTNKAALQREADDFITARSLIADDEKFGKWAAGRINEMAANKQDPSRLMSLVQARQASGIDAAKVGLDAYGAALVNKGALRPELFVEKQQPEMTPYQAASLALRDREVAAAERRAGRPDTQVTVNNSQDSEIAKLSAKDYQGFVARAANANKELATINTLESLSDKAFSGAGAGALLQGAKVLKQLGIETKGLEESEVYEKLANTLVLDKSQQMSGALSNADMTFLQNTVPSLNTSKEGRKMTFEIGRKLAEREKQVAKLATEFRKQNGGKFDSGEFQLYLDEWKEQNQLFDKESAAQPAQQPQQAPQQAIELLRSNPQFAEQFKAKYGYLPEGF